MADPISHHRLLNQQILQLPHRQDGSINYAVLGNMLTATILGEVLEVSYVDNEYGKPRNQLLKDTEANWEFLYKENDVIVFKKKRPNSKAHSFLGRGVIDVPLNKIAEYVHKFHSRLEWDDFLMQIEICKSISENDWLYYMAHEATNCLFTSKRDFFLYCRSGYVDSKYVQTSISIEDKDYPHRPPYVRGEIMEGSGWVMEKYKGSECSTLVTYVANMDLKELPAGVMDRVLKRQPMAIHHIRKKLTGQLKIFDSPKSDSPNGSQTQLEVDQPVLFEDTVPIKHYTTGDADSSVDYDSDTPMYPWVTDKKAMQQAKRNNRLLTKDSSSTTTTTNQINSLTTQSNHQSTDEKDKENKEEEGNLVPAVGSSDCSNDDQLIDNQTNNTTPISPGADFPTFSNWAKEQ